MLFRLKTDDDGRHCELAKQSIGRETASFLAVTYNF
jgi:hypothetical protein